MLSTSAGTFMVCGLNDGTPEATDYVRGDTAFEPHVHLLWLRGKGDQTRLGFRGRTHPDRAESLIIAKTRRSKKTKCLFVTVDSAVKAVPHCGWSIWGAS